MLKVISDIYWWLWFQLHRRWGMSHPCNCNCPGCRIAEWYTGLWGEWMEGRGKEMLHRLAEKAGEE